MIDTESLTANVKSTVDGWTRTSRINAAIDTPVRERTAHQAALVAVARLIESGFAV